MAHEEITNKILAACFDVSNELGCGFLESVYKNAVVLALQARGITPQCEYPLTVLYRGQTVGQFYADILVEDKVILELKAVAGLTDVHKAQLLNYLRATGVQVGMLVNFGAPRLEYRRFDNRFLKKP